MQRIEVNVLTGEQTIVELTANEIAEAQAQAAQVQIQESNTTPTLDQTIQEQQALIQSLTTRIAALEAQSTDNPVQGATP
jgi:cysteinyl-tRNA synthetase